MDFEEHRRIVFNSLQLLEGDLAVADNAAGRKLEELKEAYESSDLGNVLYITKGIHQPNNNPHMQLQLKRGTKWYGGIHLNLSVSDVDIPGLPEEYFHWVGVQFTAEGSDGTLSAKWPLVASHDGKNEHLRRRMSIAPKDIQSTIEAIARAKQEANRQEQARLLHLNRGLPVGTASTIQVQRDNRATIFLATRPDNGRYGLGYIDMERNSSAKRALLFLFAQCRRLEEFVSLLFTFFLYARV